MVMYRRSRLCRLQGISPVATSYLDENGELEEHNAETALYAKSTISYAQIGAVIRPSLYGRG